MKRALRRLSDASVPVRSPLAGNGGAEAARPLVEELREQLEQAFAAEELEITARLKDLACDPALREAVLWQNRQAVHTAIEPLLQQPPGTGGRKQRRARELLLASYLQRYCVKNDSIGFFGPVGWGRILEDSPAIRLEPGPALVDQRQVYFENWCIDALARKLGESVDARASAAPRLLPQLRLERGKLSLPGVESVELAPEHARLLACCDGRRSAAAIAESLVADRSAGFARVADVYELLDYSRTSGLIAWTLEGPMELRPERRLRERLQALGHDGLRAASLGALARLEAARSAVAGAAGDVAALDRALGEFESTFTQLTDVESTRRHGQTYAARTLLYEDCRRDVKLEVGGPLLSRLGPPLSLVLVAARWAIREMARRYREEFERAYSRVSNGAGAVSLATVLSRIPSFSGNDEADLAITREVQAEIQRRWAQALELPPAEREVHYQSRALRDRVEEVFATPDPGWRWPRYISPDVMIAGADVDAINRGEGQIVLGEVHLLNTLLHSCLVSQHPDPRELLTAVEQDHPAPCVVAVVGKDVYGQRTNIAIVSAKDYRYDSTPNGVDVESSRALREGELLLERGASGLEVRTIDGRARFEVTDFFGHLLTYSHRVLDLNPLSLPGRGHTPRVVVDGVVLWRERWEFAVEELGFAWQTDPVDRFLAARRWAAGERLPRFVFFKVPIEWKPCYADFDSPLYVDLLSKLIRGTAASGRPEPTITLTEMLPRIEQSWLVDAEGRHYTSELRIAALEIDTHDRQLAHPPA